MWLVNTLLNYKKLSREELNNLWRHNTDLSGGEESLRDRTALFILVGYLAQLLPWVFVTRVVFEYHYFPSSVFLVLALAASGLLTAGWFYTRRLNERLTAQNSRINSLETVISEQQSEMEAMEKQYATQTAAVEVYKKLTGLTPEQALEPPKQGAGRRP